MKYNIFQGNNSIRLQICKSLDLGLNPKQDIFFTKSIYKSALFYLKNRFGDPFCYDDSDKYSIWDFRVKYYIIRMELISDMITIIVFGPKEYVPKNPLWTKLNRMSKRGLHYSPLELFEDETKWKPKFAKYLDKRGIKHEEATQEDLNGFYEFVSKENTELVDELQKTHKFNEDYSNAYTRHALRTLDQFLKNMLTPIYIRDVGYNIKGRCEWCDRYKNNIKIEKVKK